MEGRIVLSKHDFLRLRSLLGGPGRKVANDREHLLDLQEEMDRATVVEPEQLPPEVVAIDSRVVVLDQGSGVSSTYTLVLPAEADASRGAISVLAPLGTALLGYRTGDEVEWDTPGGLRKLKITAVEHGEPNGDDPEPRSGTLVA